MARISIEPVKAKKALSREQELEKVLKTLYQETLNVRSGLSFKIAGQEAISARLKDAADQLNKESSSTHSLYSGLEQIIARYEQTENANVERLGAEKTSVQQGSNAQASADSGTEDVKFDWADFFTSELANLVGPFGFLFTGGKKFLENDWAGGVNEVLQSLGKVIKIKADGTDVSWKDAVLKSFKDNFDKFDYESYEFNKEFFKQDFLKKLTEAEDPGNMTKGELAGTAVKWGTTFIDRFLKNKEEFGADNWSGRFWAETGLETGIKLFEGAAISTGVGMAAAGIGSAIAAIVGAPVAIPAVAVGAATIGVSMLVDWGLNKIVEVATGGARTDWLELATDGILDGAEWVGSKVSEGIEWAGNKISAGVDKIVESVGPAVTRVKESVGYVADKVSDGFNNIKTGITNLFSGCSWGQIAMSGAGYSGGGGGW